MLGVTCEHRSSVMPNRRASRLPGVVFTFGLWLGWRYAAASRNPWRAVRVSMLSHSMWMPKSASIAASCSIAATGVMLPSRE